MFLKYATFWGEKTKNKNFKNFSFYNASGIFKIDLLSHMDLRLPEQHTTETLPGTWGFRLHTFCVSAETGVFVQCTMFDLNFKVGIHSFNVFIYQSVTCKTDNNKLTHGVPCAHGKFVCARKDQIWDLISALHFNTKNTCVVVEIYFMFVSDMLFCLFSLWIASLDLLVLLQILNK